MAELVALEEEGNGDGDKTEGTEGDKTEGTEGGDKTEGTGDGAGKTE